MAVLLGGFKQYQAKEIRIGKVKGKRDLYYLDLYFSRGNEYTLTSGTLSHCIDAIKKIKLVHSIKNVSY